MVKNVVYIGLYEYQYNTTFNPHTEQSELSPAQLC